MVIWKGIVCVMKEGVLRWGRASLDSSVAHKYSPAAVHLELVLIIILTYSALLCTHIVISASAYLCHSVLLYIYISLTFPASCHCLPFQRLLLLFL